MAAWGWAAFDSDEALDWFADLESLDDAEVPSALQAALTDATDAPLAVPGEDAGPDEAVLVGIAAAVLTAYGCARAVRTEQPEVDSWLVAHRPRVDRTLADLALEVLDRHADRAEGLPHRGAVRAALQAGPATEQVRPADPE